MAHTRSLLPPQIYEGITNARPASPSSPKSQASAGCTLSAGSAASSRSAYVVRGCPQCDKAINGRCHRCLPVYKNGVQVDTHSSADLQYREALQIARDSKHLAPYTPTPFAFFELDGVECGKNTLVSVMFENDTWYSGRLDAYNPKTLKVRIVFADARIGVVHASMHLLEIKLCLDPVTPPDTPLERARYEITKEDGAREAPCLSLSSVPRHTHTNRNTHTHTRTLPSPMPGALEVQLPMPHCMGGVTASESATARGNDAASNAPRQAHQPSATHVADDDPHSHTPDELTRTTHDYRHHKLTHNTDETQGADTQHHQHYEPPTRRHEPLTVAPSSDTHNDDGVQPADAHILLVAVTDPKMPDSCPATAATSAATDEENLSTTATRVATGQDLSSIAATRAEAAADILSTAATQTATHKDVQSTSPMMPASTMSTETPFPTAATQSATTVKFPDPPSAPPSEGADSDGERDALP